MPIRHRALMTATLTAALALGASTTASASPLDPTAFTIGLNPGAASATGTATMGLLTSTGVGSLLDSTFSLADIDPISGALTGGDIATAVNIDHAIAADLIDANVMALDAANLALASLQQAEAARQKKAASTTLPNDVPEPYRSLIPAAVATHCPQITPALLAAQIKAESNFTANATSPVGARGPAQFMPGTWQAHGIDGDGDGKATITNPADAVASAAAYDCTLRKAVNDTRGLKGSTDELMLASYNAGFGNVKKYGGVPPFAETRTYITRILEQAAAYGAAQDAGSSGVGPDGCPTSAPANTLREGAAGVGIYELCANSVDQAPNAYAAAAIKYQLAHLGSPYSQPNRMKTGNYDCSSLAMRSYHAAGLKKLSGWAPNTAAIRASSWAQRISYSAAKPGDLIFPHDGHVATMLSNGYMVHTNRPGDVSHVKKKYTSPKHVFTLNTSALL